MTLQQLLEGAKIFAKYSKGVEGTHGVGAEHDQLWLFPLEVIMTEEDESKLEALGYFPDADAGYWSHFT